MTVFWHNKGSDKTKTTIGDVRKNIHTPTVLPLGVLISEDREKPRYALIKRITKIVCTYLLFN